MYLRGQWEIRSARVLPTDKEQRKVGKGKSRQLIARARERLVMTEPYLLLLRIPVSCLGLVGTTLQEIAVSSNVYGLAIRHGRAEWALV
jgi:hypothetical protein